MSDPTKPVRARRSRQGGNALLEFAVVFPTVVTLFFGSVGLGIMLGRYIQAIQVCRDIAHMYADKTVDFTSATAQKIVTQQLASGVGMTSTGGNGVVILTRVITLYDNDCIANGVPVNKCTNYKKPVITQRIIIGNSSLRTSNYGTAPSGSTDAAGNVSGSKYTIDPNLVAGNFETVAESAQTRALGSSTNPAQQAGDASYIAEVYFKYPDLGFLGWTTAGGAYASFFFQ